MEVLYMKKIIKITAVFCIIALLASCGLVSKEEKKDTKKNEVVVTIGKTKVTEERFNFYLYTTYSNYFMCSA